ncbi:hypothetical protein GOODEAATRI_031730 [Goodea atripinnis]|uniref:Uncharacterized protein n=1 Tax=Goodea atripinnis TaxID=208336 RepID=A0ABV0P9E9_9TELE
MAPSLEEDGGRLGLGSGQVVGFRGVVIQVQAPAQTKHLDSCALAVPIKCGAYFHPTILPASGLCLCPLAYLWFSVSGAGCFGMYWLTPGACLPGPAHLGSVRPLLRE